MDFSKITILACAALTLIVSGCGTQRQAQTTQAPAESRPQHTAALRHNTDSPRRQELIMDHPQREESARAERAKTATPRHAMTFSGAECNYVRPYGIATLSGGGLVLSLDEMADEFCYPCDGPMISDYGMRSRRMHSGVDIRANLGDTIRAAFPGVVRMSKVQGNYGNLVVVRHYNGLETVYGHNTRNLVKVNDVVEAGQPIALAGRTGNATCVHLHLEVRASGDPINPNYLFDTARKSLQAGWIHISDRDGIVLAASTKEGLEQSRIATLAARADASAAKEKAFAESTVGGQPKGSSTPQAVYHKIVKGDTLSALARRHNTTVTKICQLNGLNNPDKLALGQRLRVK